MQLQDIIKPDSVLCNANARSKKHCLEILSELLVRSLPDVAAEDIFGKLIERERLGCTSLKKGVAFPHCRVDGLETSQAALIKLTEAIEFDAADGEPVDIVFGLLVPKDVDDEHMAEIKMITGVLGDEDLRGRLRECNTTSRLYDTLIGGSSLGSAQEWQTKSA
ncbi:MAG: PTS sugar transporter subunit IIA [Woeseiaceae bacterium]|nr:PTS sugar transporter subunit IIA [Woeseiaceae bacterium]